MGTFDLTEEGVLEKLQNFSGGGLFAKTSLAIVYHPEEGEKEFVKFLKEIALDETVSVIVVADKKLTKEFAFLYDGKEKQFENLSGADFLKFIKAEAKARDLVVSDAQIKAIGAAYDGDTWGAMTEIERVAAGGAVIQHRAQVNDFDLLRQFASARDLPRKLGLLMQLLEYSDAAKTFNLLGAFVYAGDKIRMADYDIAIKSGKLEYADALLDFTLA